MSEVLSKKLKCVIIAICLMNYRALWLFINLSFRVEAKHMQTGLL